MEHRIDNVSRSLERKPLLLVLNHGLGSFARASLTDGKHKLSLYHPSSKHTLTLVWRHHYIPHNRPFVTVVLILELSSISVSAPQNYAGKYLTTQISDPFSIDWSMGLLSLNKFPVITCQSKETTDFRNIRGRLPVHYSFDLLRIHTNTFCRNDMTQESYFVQPKLALTKLSI